MSLRTFNYSGRYIDISNLAAIRDMKVLGEGIVLRGESSQTIFDSAFYMVLKSHGN